MYGMKGGYSASCTGEAVDRGVAGVDVQCKNDAGAIIDSFFDLSKFIAWHFPNMG